MRRNERRQREEDVESDEEVAATLVTVVSEPSKPASSAPHQPLQHNSDDEEDEEPESLEEFLSSIMNELKRARTIAQVEELGTEMQDYFNEFECKGHEQEIASLLNVYASDLKTLDFAVLAFSSIVTVSLYEHVSCVLRERCLSICPMTPGGRLFTEEKNSVLIEGGWSVSPLKTQLYQDDLYKMVIAKIGSVFERRANARGVTRDDADEAERQRLQAELLEDEKKNKKKPPVKAAKPAKKVEKGKPVAQTPQPKKETNQQKKEPEKKRGGAVSETIEEILANAAKKCQFKVESEFTTQGFVPVRSVKPSAKAATKKKESEYSVTIATFPILKNLYAVVLKSKLEGKFRALQLTAIEKSVKETTQGGPNLEVTLRIQGPEPDATFARDEVQRIANDPRGTLSKVEFTFSGRASSARLADAPRQLQCVLNYLNKKSSDTRQRWFVASYVQLTGEALPEYDVLVSRARDFLIYDPVAQARPHRLRDDGDTSNSDYDLEEVEESDGDELGEDDESDDAEDENLYERGEEPLEELPKPRVLFRESHYSKEVEKAAGMNPQAAVDYLKRIVEKFQERFDQDVLGWLRFMYLVEQHYALAMLAKYERTNINLNVSSNYDCVLTLQPKEERFSERRPSVQVDDKVIVAVGRPARQFFFRIYHVEPSSLKLLLDSSAHGKNEKAAIVKAVTSQPVTLMFDPEPVTSLCQVRARSATCENALNFLVTPQARLPRPTESWRRLAQRARDTSTDRPLTTEQHYALHTILSFPKGIRSLFISGPPGTGKSEVISQAIKELLVTRRDVKIVVCAPSHSAVDVVCERVVKLFTAERSARRGDSLPEAESVIRRVHSPYRSPFLTTPILLPFTSIGVMAGKQFRDLDSADRFDLVSHEFLSGASLVCCSIAQVGKVVSLVKGVDYLFVDEVAQAHLADVLNPVEQVIRNPSSFVVFSGDALQVRPHCLAPFLRQWIHRSPMFYATKYGRINTVELVESFRQNEALCNLQSKLFYNGKLQFHPTDERSGADRTARWVGHRMNPQPMRFIHHEGVVNQESLEDETERNLVTSAITSLCTDVQVDEKEIVVVCGSAAQRRGIKNYLHIHGYKLVRVLEILDFHGAECDVVIICSLHASNESTSLSPSATGDSSVTMQELNTAMSRARHLVLLFGNGNRLLSSTRDNLWKRTINVLKERRAIDGYNYIDEKFDASCYVPLPVPVGALKIRAYVPGPVTKGDLNERREIACFVDRTRHTPLEVHDYVRRRHLFVGTVVIRSVNEDGEYSYLVRNRNCSGHDAAVDVECSAGRLNIVLVPGETVALCIDDARAEACGASAALCGYLTTVLPPQFASGTPELSSGSHVLDDYDQQMTRPKGPLAAHLYFPVFPPVQLKVVEVDTLHNKAWAAAPSISFLPVLPCVLPRSGCPPIGMELVGNLKRTSDGTLVYDVLLPEETRLYGSGLVGAGLVPELPGGLNRNALNAIAFKASSFTPVDSDSYFSIAAQDVREDLITLKIQVPFWVPLLRRSELDCAYDMCFGRESMPNLFSGDAVLRRALKEFGYIPLFQITASLSRVDRAWMLSEKRVYLVRCESYLRATSPNRILSSSLARTSRILLHDVFGVVSSRFTSHVDPWVCLAGLISAEAMLAFRPLDSILVCEHVSPEKNDVTFDAPKWFVPHTPDNKIIQIDGFYGPCPAAFQPISFISSGTTRLPDLVAQNLLAAAISSTGGVTGQRQLLSRIVERINSAAALIGLGAI